MHANAGLQRTWTYDALCAYLDSLPRDNDVDWRSYEIIDGALVVSPQAAPWHEFACAELRTAIGQALPSGFRAVSNLGVEMARSYLVPDVIVVPMSVFGKSAGPLQPSEVLLAIEVVSPGSVTMDRLMKPAQYAAAGIPSYWRVERDPEPSLTAYRLTVGAAVYEEVGTWSGDEVAHLTEPFPATIRVGQLVPPAAP
jgi:Uma2 family endonuclease